MTPTDTLEPKALAEASRILSIQLKSSGRAFVLDETAERVASDVVRAYLSAASIPQAGTVEKEDPLWRKLRDLFGFDGWHDGTWHGIPSPEQIVTHVEYVAEERARLMFEAAALATPAPEAPKQDPVAWEWAWADDPFYWNLQRAEPAGDKYIKRALVYRAPSAPSAPPAEAQPVAAKELDMASAPKDGTVLRLLVKYDHSDMRSHPIEDSEGPSWTIGSNSFENTEIDEWSLAGWDWEQDCYTQSTGTPIGWLPFHTALSHPLDDRVANAFGRGFITCNSDGQDGRYEVVAKFKTLKEAQDAHTALVATLEPSPSATNASLAAPPVAMPASSLKMWVIYYHPSDFPDKYVARLWIVEEGKVVATTAIHTTNTLDDLRSVIRAIGGVDSPICRSPSDDPVVVEIWV